MYTAELPHFTRATTEKIGSYVYALADNEDRIFYVGKGIGNRVFDHVREVQSMLMADPDSLARLTDEDKDDDSDRFLGDKQRRIGELLLVDKVPAMYILRDSLTDDQALVIESVLISVLDWQLDKGLTNLAAGHGTRSSGLKTVQELEATSGEPFDVMKLPGAASMLGKPVMAININRRWAEVESGEKTLLAVSSGHWRVSLDRANQCQFAIVHARGVVRGVFQISGWSSSTLYGGRCVFNPVGLAPVVGHEFSNKNASSLFGPAGSGSQNPIRYVKVQERAV